MYMHYVDTSILQPTFPGPSVCVSLELISIMATIFIYLFIYNYKFITLLIKKKLKYEDY